MELKKIYICGQSHGGKGLLAELIDSHNNVVAVPLHNFGLSHIYKIFHNHIKTGEYANKIYLTDPDIKSKFILGIKAADNKVYHPQMGDLLQFLIKYNSCFRSIFQAHFSKQMFIHTVSSQWDCDLSFESYLDEFKKLVIAKSNDILTLEQIDDMLYLSFLASVKQFNKFNHNCDYFAVEGHNSIEQITTLFTHYNNFKIIYVERDFISRLYAYSMTKSISKNLEDADKNEIIYEIMLNRLNKDKEIEINYNNILNDYLKKYDYKIMKVKFEDLKYDSPTTMKKIYHFLNLDPNKVNNSPLSGIRMGNADEKDPYDIYDSEQIDYLNKMLESKGIMGIPLRYRFNNFRKKIKAKVSGKLNK